MRHKTRLVAVDYFKWPDRWCKPYKGSKMELLGTDPFGRWLWSPASGSHASADHDSFMTLLPADGWWTATWIRCGGHEKKIWVDITTPPVWRTPWQVSLVDLEVDVQRLPNGVVEILDEAEFVQRAQEWAYPSEVLQEVPVSVRFIAASLLRLEDPFGEVAQRWLRTALGRR